MEEYYPDRLQQKIDSLGVENARLLAEVDGHMKLLERLHDWVKGCNDWRPDSQLGRMVRNVLGTRA